MYIDDELLIYIDDEEKFNDQNIIKRHHRTLEYQGKCVTVQTNGNHFSRRWKHSITTTYQVNDQVLQSQQKSYCSPRHYKVLALYHTHFITSTFLNS